MDSVRSARLCRTARAARYVIIARWNKLKGAGGSAALWSGRMRLDIWRKGYFSVGLLLIIIIQIVVIYKLLFDNKTDIVTDLKLMYIAKTLGILWKRFFCRRGLICTWFFEGFEYTPERGVGEPPFYGLSGACYRFEPLIAYPVGPSERKVLCFAENRVVGMCDAFLCMNRRPALLKKESGLFDKEETRSQCGSGFCKRTMCIVVHFTVASENPAGWIKS